MPLSPSNPNPDKSKGLRSFLLWLAFALLLRWQVLEPRWIPSGSMLPTLQLQDRILIEKISPRISRATKKSLSIGSVVVFQAPSILVEAGYDKNSALIKRVVGLPGDHIEVQNGNLIRNGQLINEKWREEQIAYEMKSITVPDHQFWVLGDNRNNSLDSHIWGPLPEENVIGTAIWRYWPLKNFGPIRFPDQKDIESFDQAAIRSRS